MKLKDVTNFIRTKNIHLNQNDYKKLINLLEQMCANEEKHLHDIKKRADHLFRCGNFESAHQLYTEYLKACEDDFIVLSNRAAASYKLGNDEDVLSDCKLAISINPAFTKLYLRMGLAYIRMGDLVNGIQSFETGLVVEPDHSVLNQQLEIARKQLNPESNNELNDKGLEEDVKNMDLNDLLAKACSIAENNSLYDIDQISTNDEFKKILNIYFAEKTEEEKKQFLNDVASRLKTK